ncbi:hypothetical protein JCM12298_17900 [Desulfothermus naphthae]
MKRIVNSLKRQLKALGVLHSLQKQEYKILLKNNKKELSKNQFAIQRLLYQLQKEKQELLDVLEKKFRVTKLSQLPELINSEEQKDELKQLIEKIRIKENQCMEQATKNADLAIAYLEQTQDLVNFLYDQIRPKAKDVYSKYGTLDTKTTGPCIVSGRL